MPGARAIGLQGRHTGAQRRASGHDALYDERCFQEYGILSRRTVVSRTLYGWRMDHEFRLRMKIPRVCWMQATRNVRSELRIMALELLTRWRNELRRQ